MDLSHYFETFHYHYSPQSLYYHPLFEITPLLKLRPDDVLQGDSVGGELADALAQLLDGHLVLVEVKAEGRLVVDVRLLLNVKSRSGRSVELLGNRLCRVVELLKEGGLVTHS